MPLVVCVSGCLRAKLWSLHLSHCSMIYRGSRGCQEGKDRASAMVDTKDEQQTRRLAYRVGRLRRDGHAVQRDADPGVESVA